MAVRIVTLFDEQTGVTATGDSFIVDPSKEVSVAMLLTAGTPVTGAKIQITLDEAKRINDGTATWTNSPLGLHTSTSIEKMLRPVTGVRLVATDGTWTAQVRQA